MERIKERSTDELILEMTRYDERWEVWAELVRRLFDELAEINDLVRGVTG